VGCRSHSDVLQFSIAKYSDFIIAVFRSLWYSFYRPYSEVLTALPLCTSEVILEKEIPLTQLILLYLFIYLFIYLFSIFNIINTAAKM